jgi:hypothetical protein
VRLFAYGRQGISGVIFGARQPSCLLLENENYCKITIRELASPLVQLQRWGQGLPQAALL